MKKIYPFFGLIGPIIYIIAVFIGGALLGGYNPLYNSISELIMTGSPNLLLLSILFGLYNFLLLLFGLGMVFDSGFFRFYWYFIHLFSSRSTGNACNHFWYNSSCTGRNLIHINNFSGASNWIFFQKKY